MLLFRYVLAALAAVVASGFVYDMCTSPQWQAVQQTLAGTNTDGAAKVIQETKYVFYDQNNTRIATRVYNFKPGYLVDKRNIFDYKHKIWYKINKDSCKKFPLEDPFRPACIPQNFSYTWMKTYYGIDVKNLFWVFEFQGDMDGLHFIIQTTYNGNLVYEQVYGEQGGAPLFSNTAFVNMTGLDSPSIFDPPPGCKTAPLERLIEPLPRRYGIMAF